MRAKELRIKSWIDMDINIILIVENAQEFPQLRKIRGKETNDQQ